MLTEEFATVILRKTLNAHRKSKEVLGRWLSGYRVSLMLGLEGPTGRHASLLCSRIGKDPEGTTLKNRTGRLILWVFSNPRTEQGGMVVCGSDPNQSSWAALSTLSEWLLVLSLLWKHQNNEATQKTQRTDRNNRWLHWHFKVLCFCSFKTGRKNDLELGTINISFS